MSQPQYLEARDEWDHRSGKLSRSRWNWQVMAFLMGLLCVVLSIGLVLGHQQRKVQTVVVSEGELGDLIALGQANALVQADDRNIVHGLSRFIQEGRSVVSDRALQKRWIDRTYRLVVPKVGSFLNEFYRENDPYQVIAKKRSIDVRVKTILPVTEETWQIRWEEKERGLLGGSEPVRFYQALVGVAIEPGEAVDDVIDNPLGLLITSLSWSEETGGKERR